MFSALAENHGEMNYKIDQFIAMAPIVNMYCAEEGKNKPLTRQEIKAVMTFSNLFNFHSITSVVSNTWESAFCTKFPKTCSQFTAWFHTGGKYDNPKADDLYNQQVHSGASIKEFLHYVQDALNNDFR